MWRRRAAMAACREGLSAKGFAHLACLREPCGLGFGAGSGAGSGSGSGSNSTSRSGVAVSVR